MSVAEFRPFRRLPAELQDLVWQHAMPEPKVYEVFDAPAPTMPRSNPANHLSFADVRNERPPPISNACRGAREAVMRRYKPIVLSGTVKFLDLRRDVLLFDSYLQVRRLLKAIRLLSQVDVIRKNISQIALGTSWGLHAGLQLRLFHRSVQTKRNMAKLLKHLAQFKKLEAVVLIVYQKSAFSLQVQWLDQRCFAWNTTPTPTSTTRPAMQRHIHEHQPSRMSAASTGAAQSPGFHYNYHVNFNLENYWLRRPCHSSLEDYITEDTNEMKGTHNKLNSSASKSCGTAALDIEVQANKLSNTTSHITAATPRQETQTAGRDLTMEGTAWVGSEVKAPVTHMTSPTHFNHQPPQALKPTQPRHNDPYDTQPKPHQVRALKATFQKWADETIADDMAGKCMDERGYMPRPAKRPRLEAATLTWVYAGVSNTTVY